MNSPNPNLYHGQPIPLLALDEHGFENFVYTTLSEVGPLHGFRVVAGPATSSDSGFDVDGERISDERRVVIQCKRLASAFHLNMIGAELAKISLKAKLEDYDIAEHLFIVASTAGETLRSALRERHRVTLANTAANAAENHPNLTMLRDQALVRGLNLRQTAEQYVHALEHVRVWTGRDFDQELGRVWSKILPTLERFFALEHVLREHPRPDFNHSNHRSRCNSLRPLDQVELAALPSDLPPNLLRTNGEDPLWREKKPDLGALGADDDPFLVSLAKAPAGACTVLHGPGGSGKTNTLLSLLGTAFESAEEEVVTPIFVRLSTYSGDLRRNIHDALKISYGIWTSMPGRFLLLLDGLDEVPFGKTQSFLDELALVLESERIAAIVTIRDTGLRSPVALGRFGHSLKLQPITFRQSVELAQRTIPGKQLQDFLEQLRSRLHVFEQELLLLPFGFATACKVFLDTGKLPADSATLLEAILQLRLRRNRMRAQALEERLRDVPETTIRKIAAQVAFGIRVQRQRTSLAEEEWYALLAESLPLLRASTTPGISTLSDLDVQVLLRHYELVDVLPEGGFRMVHDLLADLLAAPLLATRWETHREHLKQMVGSEVWLHAARFVQEGQREAFLKAIYEVDPILAARSAYALGPLMTCLLTPLVLNDELRDTALSIFQTSACMTILGTPECLAQLHHRFVSEQETSKRFHQAVMALAWRGDVTALAWILEYEEPGLSSGIRISSSYLNAWWNAPAAATLSLARARIDANPRDARIVLCLRTIQSFGDDTDLEGVKSVVQGTSNLPTLYAAGNCLHALKAAYAVTVFEAELIGRVAKDALPFLELLSDVMRCPVDTTPLLQKLLESPLGGDEEDMKRDRLLKLVCRQALPAGWESRIRSAYDRAGQYERTDLWQIATAHRLPEFDELAFEVTDRSPEFGSVIRFAMARTWSEEQQTRFAELCSARIASASDGESFEPGALEFLLMRGMHDEVATFVIQCLASFGPRHQELRRGVRDRARRQSGGKPIDREEFHYMWIIPELVKIAEQVAELLPDSLKLEMVGYDLTMTGEAARQARVNIVSNLPPSDIDAALAKISEAEDQIPVLSDISELGSSAKRIEILCDALPRVLGFPTHDEAFARAIDRLWSRPVVEAVVRAVGEWRQPYGMETARKTINMVAKKLTKEYAATIVLPQLTSATQGESQEILKWWYEVGLRGHHQE